jgi:hypothetical protein
VGAEDKRRELRFPARIAARVTRRRAVTELLTNDVSFRGAFVRTDAPPALRQLVKVSFTLPTGEHIAAHAMVVHVVPPGSGPVPGMGVQFWGPVEGGKAWEKFVYELKVRERAGAASSRATDKVRRSSERFKLQLEVVLDDQRLSTRDISATGMAVRSDLAMPVGTRAEMQLRASGQEPVTVDVIVRRRIEETEFKGLGVEFVDLQVPTREALMALLRPVATEDGATFIGPDDPELH